MARFSELRIDTIKRHRFQFYKDVRDLCFEKLTVTSATRVCRGRAIKRLMIVSSAPGKQRVQLDSPSVGGRVRENGDFERSRLAHLHASGRLFRVVSELPLRATDIPRAWGSFDAIECIRKSVRLAKTCTSPCAADWTSLMIASIRITDRCLRTSSFFVNK